MDNFKGAPFVKSSRSDHSCVEVARPTGAVGVRDSKTKTDCLEVSPAAWSAFVTGVKGGRTSN